METQTIIDRQELLEAFRLHSAGSRKKAEARYRKIIGVDPNQPDSLHVLGGLAHCVDENEAAIELLNQAIQLSPDRSHFYHTLGDVYKEQGKLNNALQCFQKALDLNSEAVDTLISLGQTYHLVGRLADAESCYQRALKLNPDNSPGLVGLGNIFKEQGCTKEAEFFYERFLKISPNSGVEIKSALLLPVIYESKESIGRYRRRIPEKIESLKIRNKPVADPYKQVGVTNFILAYHGINNKELLKKIADFYLQICPDLSWTSPHCYRSGQADERITIGIVSRFLRKHTIGYLNFGIIKHLNREKFRIKLFCYPGESDSLAKAIQQVADEVIPLPDDLKKARRIIADQAVDILFYPDIGMEPFTYFIAYSRLAPVQCTTWGHADTTGIPNMDYFLSSLHAEPPNSSEHYSEQLILLKRFAMYCYLPELPAEVSPLADIGLGENCNLYICPQSLFKFHPDFDAIIAAILKRDPNGTLLLFNGKHASWTRLLQDRFQSMIPEVAERIRFHPRVPADEFLAILMRADVILDPLHFGGGYTSLLCLSGGLPIVTLPGAFMRGRMTYALYKQMGLLDCVATDRKSFVDLALKLANNKSWNHKIRNKIKERTPALFEDMEAVHELERFFEWSLKKKQSGAGIGLIPMEMKDAFRTNAEPAESKRKGDFFQSQGMPAEAIVCYQEAVKQNPQYAEALNNMGIAYKKQKRLDSAVACYREALKIYPEYAVACNNLANAFREQGNLNEAEKWYQEALKFKPDLAEAYNNLGNVLRQKGRLDEAIISYQSALRIKSDYAEAHNNLGSAFQEQKAFSQAVDCYQNALKFNPNNPATFNNLGNVYQKQGQLHQAIACYHKAVVLKPDFFEAFNSMANALVEFGKISQSLEYYEKALAVNPAYTVAHSNLLLALHYHIDGDLSTCRLEAEKWWQQHQAAYSESFSCEQPFDSRKRLKIGYLSPDFRQHSVSFFFLPLIQHQDSNLVEIFCYSEVILSDHVTDKIKKLSDHWRPTIGLPDDSVAEQIRKDGIDILVDLAGHTAGNRLPVFARKPAPVQITWLGYPDTTGMPVIDYRLTDEIADPQGEADQFHSETLIRLPEGFLCYGPPDDAPPVSGLPARKTGGITFGSFNNLPKVNEAVIGLWSQLLHRLADSCLVLKSKQFADEHVRRRFLEMFSANGITAERIRLLPRTPSTVGHLGLYHQIDIGLDPFPYNGTTTTCEALWMGVPVISLRGNRHAGRVGASILTRVGLQELVAEDEAAYVRIGIKLAQDLDGLERMRAGMRSCMQASTLCDAGAFARNMEDTFRMVWKHWCKSDFYS